jgi:hypothetical protein
MLQVQGFSAEFPQLPFKLLLATIEPMLIINTNISIRKKEIINVKNMIKFT